VEITLSSQSDEVLDAFERAVARIPDVLECHLMAGSADYLLKTRRRADTEDFARIHRQLPRPPARRGADAVVLFAAHGGQDHGAGGRRRAVSSRIS
jgi:DNA-binding Lrp family transcriptional regulator